MAGAEPLEQRLALAGTFTFTDVDGDTVTVKTSLGTNALLGSAVQLKAAGLGSQLTGISLKHPAFSGTSLSIVAVKKGGDGLVNVGKIDASGLDLGTVTVEGDLATLVAGDANAATPGVVSLNVRSLGKLGLSTGATGLQSSVTGRLITLKVDDSVVGASLSASTIDTAFVGGSVVGATAPHSGEIACSGTIGSIVVKGSIVGGAGSSSGVISATNIVNATVYGSVVGGRGVDSGGIHASAALGPVAIKQDILGGDGTGSGHVEADSSITGLSVRNVLGGAGDSSGHVGAFVKKGPLPIVVRGSLVGGDGASSGTVEIDSVVNSMHVFGSIAGGAGVNSGVVSVMALLKLVVDRDVRGGRGDASGVIGAIAGIGTATVSGTLAGGAGAGTGRIESLGASIGSAVVLKGIAGGDGAGSGSIRAFDAIGSVTVAQSVVGGAGGNSGVILAGGKIGKVAIATDLVGQAGPGSGAIVSGGGIQDVTVGGSILGGSADSSGAVRAGLSLASLVVKGAVVGMASHPVLVTATGSDGLVAMPSISIAGRLHGAMILAGYSNDVVPAPVASMACIGTVSVGGTLSGASIVAGAKNADFPNFGTVADVRNSPSSPSSIGAVTLGGVLETAASNDHYGVVAAVIGGVTLGKQKLALPPAGGVVPLGGVSDVTIHRLG